MKESERSDIMKLAKLMRCARKQLGLTQVQVAKALDIAQGTYSKIEKAKFVLSTPEWFTFCKLTNIDVNSFVHGYIDRCAEVQISDAFQVGSFKIPSKYGKAAGTTVRDLQPYLLYFKNTLGEDKLNACLKDQFKIDPDYFVDMGNKVNVNFLTDFINHLITKAGISAKTVKTITQYVAQAESHGRLFDQYKNSSDQISAIEAFVVNSPKYHANTLFKVVNKTGNTIEVSSTRNFSNVTTPELANFIVEYRASYLEQLAKSVTGKNENVIVTYQKNAAAPADGNYIYKVQLSN